MKLRSFFPLFAWAVRDVFRYPFETTVLFLSLAALVTIVGTALLLSQAISTTAGLLLKESPAVVVRRVGAGGWAALPSAESIQMAESVPGVLHADIRIWGTANGPRGPVTVYGVNPSVRIDALIQKLTLPKRGEAVIGAGVLALEDDFLINLVGHHTLDLKVIGVLDPKTSLVAHDIVLVHPDDARRILGIAQGYATDLTVDVFHESEADAILADLAGAFPWPVRMSTRNEAAGIYSSASARRSTIVYITIIPGLLALALVVVGVVKNQVGRNSMVGLLKSFGWTTTDIFKWQLLKAVVTGFPAVTAGMVFSYCLVFGPETSWPGYLFFGWNSHPPALFLDASGSFLILIEIGMLIFLPYLAATLWPALQAACSDPQDFLENT
jgi:hypothetical protein